MLVACSGGADSVALVKAMHHLASRRGFEYRLEIGHVVHGLRSDGSDLADAQWVQSLTDQLELPFHRVELDPGCRPERSDCTNDEAWARIARDAALVQMARNIGTPLIATAHQADDQIETFLMRVLRGTTVRGLRGIAWSRPPLVADPERQSDDDPPIRFIRPMLQVPRTEVIDYLNACQQAWCDDPTNLDLRRLRARLRSNITPELWDLQPRLHERVQNLIDSLPELSPSPQNNDCD